MTALPEPAGPPRSSMATGRAPLNVVFLARNLRLGGAERAFVHYVNHVKSFQPVVALLDKNGELLPDIQPRVSVYDLSQPLPSNFRTAEPGAKPEPPAKPRRLTPVVSGAALLVQCLRLRRIVRSTGATTIASFLMRSHLVALFTKLFLAPDVRVVLNVHEHMSDSAEYLYPTLVDRLLMRWFVRHLFPRADLIITVAACVKRDLVETFGLPAERIVVVNNPIDLDQIRCRAAEPVSQWSSADGRPPRVVAVGRLVRLKGFDSLIRAMGSTRGAGAPTLHIVGDGPERERLQALIESLDLADRVRLVGNDANPWKYIAGADLLALSSRTEAFPYVIGEALALGTPVVSTDCSEGIREYLQDGRCGLIVPPRDDAALAAGVARMLVDDAARREYEERGKARVRPLGLAPAIEVFERTMAPVIERRAAGSRTRAQ